MFISHTFITIYSAVIYIKIIANFYLLCMTLAIYVSRIYVTYMLSLY